MRPSFAVAATAAKVPSAIVMQPTAGNSARKPAVLGSTQVLTKDEEIFAEGDAASYFYKVVSGTVRTYKLMCDGRRQIDAFHLAGDIFGLEIDLEHRFSAEAVDNAIVIAYRRSPLDALSRQNPGFGDEVMMSMIRSLERAQDHMLLLGRKTAQEKIATFLMDLAARMHEDDRFELPMQRTDIADYLGLTIETVSRTLTQFAREGLIKLAASSRNVVLADRMGLQRLNA
jgi:CRP/FNR family nitrogen fixation transcriptional regulator